MKVYKVGYYFCTLFALFLYVSAAQALEINAYCTVEVHSTDTKRVNWHGTVLTTNFPMRFSGCGYGGGDKRIVFWRLKTAPDGTITARSELGEFYPNVPPKKWADDKDLSRENISEITFLNKSGSMYTFKREKEDKLLRNSIWTINAKTYTKYIEEDDSHHTIYTNYSAKCNLNMDEMAAGDVNSDAYDELKLYPDYTLIGQSSFHPKDKKGDPKDKNGDSCSIS